MRRFSALLGALAVFSGCTGDLQLPGDTTAAGGAAIVGRLSDAGATGKLLALAQGSDCPEVKVSLNGVAVSITMDDDCGFLVDGVEPAELLELRVELPDLGVAGTVEISAVDAGELIEVQVGTSAESLSIEVLRRVEPGSNGALPTVVSGNNVSLKLDAGVYDQPLTVDGNNFTLTGEAGEGCDADGWTEISGPVTVEKNNATFRNVSFKGGVTVRGNNAQFINCCFDGQLIVLGNNLEIGDHEEDEKDDEPDDESGQEDDLEQESEEHGEKQGDK